MCENVERRSEVRRTGGEMGRKEKTKEGEERESHSVEEWERDPGSRQQTALRVTQQ